MDTVGERIAGRVAGERPSKRGLSWRSFLKSPLLEIGLMTVLVIISFIAMGAISTGVDTPEDGMSAGAIAMVLLGFFMLSYAIALIAVIAGIGGGVIFTPVMLAFTDVHSLVVRATGLIVAMFSGLVSTGPFMRRGLANLKLCILLAASYGIGAFLGATGAIMVAQKMGESGEAAIRVILGVIVVCIAGYFIWGGTKMEWPEIKRVDGFTRRLGIPLPYYEQSLDKVVEYQVTRAWAGIIAIMFVGILSGFFGMGGGWAAVPAMNMVMGVPLKVAAACSGVLLGMGDCIAVWPYLLKGAIIPLFAAPWLVGQVLGGITGAYLLIRIKAGFVRNILIGLLFFTSFALITKGLNKFGVMGEVPFAVNGAVFMVIVAGVALAIMGKLPNPLRRS